MATADQPVLTVTPYSVAQLRELSHAAPTLLYAILDACGEPRVPLMVRQLPPGRATCLYRGWAARDYWAVAPYLCVVDEHVLDWIIENLWSDPWGIFMSSEASFDWVRRHLRRFLTVQDEDGEQMYFRFYDPRVLPTFLESSTREENIEFFGSVNKFIVTVTTPAASGHQATELWNLSLQ